MPAEPTLTSALTAWTAQPVAIAVCVLAAGWYVTALRRHRGGWPAGRGAVSTLGLFALVYTTCGFPAVYVDSLFYVWTSQQLALLLVVPYLLLAGQPWLLTRGRAQRLFDSRFVRAIGNPLIGPALVPVVSVVLFFGPLPRWSVQYAVLGWIEPFVVLAVGMLIVLPLVGATGPRTSLAVGLSLVIGSFELVLDAVPGIALRLHRSLSTSYFDVRTATDWAPSALHDQQIAGAVLWAVAELLDLPFLILVYRQWIKADARDAAQVDAVLEAERISRGTELGDLSRDEPWWLSDPDMKRRMAGGTRVNRPR